METMNPPERVLVSASEVRRVYEGFEHTHASLGKVLGVSRETATRFLSRGIVIGCNPHVIEKLTLLLKQMDSAQRWRKENTVVFAIEQALKFKPLFGDTNSLEQGSVKATLFKTNQTLLMEMAPDALATHARDEQNSKLATIEVLSGSVVLEYGLKRGRDATRLKAGTRERAAFNISGPYTISAEEESRVLLLSRPNTPSPEEREAETDGE